MVQKGKIFEITKGKVRISHGNNVTPLLASDIEFEVGDIVAFVIFKDGTGIVLGKV